MPNAGPGAGLVRVRVWDAPTRLFHWTLVALLAFSWFSGEQGDDWLRWHFLSGYAVMTLVLFRLLWGVFGSTYSRFGHFLRGPGAALRHLHHVATGRGEPDYGHNALGAWMIVLMLALLLVQVGTGLFSEDEFVTTGPLGMLVSGPTRRWMSNLHSTTVNIILVLAGMHVTAVLAYLVLRRQNLIGAMLTGYKRLERPDPAGAQFRHPGLALALLAVAALVVWRIVRLGG